MLCFLIPRKTDVRTSAPRTLFQPIESIAAAGDLACWAHDKISEMTTRRNPPTIRDIAALTLRVWREAAAFFLSIELVLMLLVVAATVGGLFLAVMHDAHSLLAFGFAIAYVAARATLHVRRILSWPFI